MNEMDEPKWSLFELRQALADAELALAEAECGRPPVTQGAGISVGEPEQWQLELRQDELKALQKPVDAVNLLKLVVLELRAKIAAAENEQAQTAEPIKPPLARNLDRLRKECGLSQENLALKVGIDRSLLRGHLNGKGINPETLKRYAEAFTLLLDRKVSVAELESPDNPTVTPS